MALERRANLRRVERHHFLFELRVPRQRAADEQPVTQCARGSLSCARNWRDCSQPDLAWSIPLS
jgi:hypothetical protein